MGLSVTARLPGGMLRCDISDTEGEAPHRGTPASFPRTFIMIRHTIFAAAAALTLMSGAAMAQTVTQDDVGSFVRDSSGHVIGSLQAIQNGQAIVHLGFFNSPGNRLVTMPATQLTGNSDRVVLHKVPSAVVAYNK
jgi:hypothetical protein